jgi:receptor expression-enhancing protein 5/6
VSPSIVVLALLVLVLLFIVFGFGANAAVSLVGFLYPLFESFKALKADRLGDRKQWLTYWIVIGLFSLVESCTSLLETLIPMYHLIKMAFIVWLYLPQTRGAEFLYVHVVEPLLVRYETNIDDVLRKGNKLGEQLLEKSKQAVGDKIKQTISEHKADILDAVVRTAMDNGDDGDDDDSGASSQDSPVLINKSDSEE